MCIRDSLDPLNRGQALHERGNRLDVLDLVRQTRHQDESNPDRNPQVGQPAAELERRRELAPSYLTVGLGKSGLDVEKDETHVTEHLVARSRTEEAGGVQRSVQT